MDTCHHGRIRCWECARVQEMQERVQELEQAIREALGRMKHGGAGTWTYVEHVLKKVLEEEREENDKTENIGAS